MRSGDEGVATVWAAGVIAMVMVLAGLVAGVGAALVTRHRAEAAADLAALSGAVHAVSGEEAACARARWVADRMRVEVVGCRLSGWDVSVHVAARPPTFIAAFGPAESTARAGPVGNGQTVGLAR
ncbi:helicase/secretion neighborhood TadE-like protein [Actinokineospora alba]|uniref:Helicase/secretion neighborhood TadE-like protein n=1 Tax=Actinokineospora alba TaxID=504798 RepID=A0A1H0SZK0_9PSEU|nr:Rv3654c family TadE-like protein [Actinokineospora alba]TDP66461.1 secretion/DNA translocation related TadE-like protein [Actinokineospora alba]SDJ52191.1 helicase/secretion neighborhood TadE-like protein [Actinokineospora alba]SDP46965.1 helicase/secretion neighborhood TadE-like protein [Actinokineospora alba]